MSKIILSTICAACLICAVMATAQTPPPPRPPVPGAAPNPIAGLSASELAYFNEGLRRFLTHDSVTGTQPGAPDAGLGPRFNLNNCAGCHANPTAGGSSPALNPQIPVATEYGARNSIPSFIQPNGPVRVARFVKNADGSADGGVHDLFVITGRADAAGCTIAQPDFATAVAQNNVIYRIPTPVFGAGLIEAIDDSTILAASAANASQKATLGIAGHVNRSGNDGTVSRFGWKAQNKSLLMFAGEAYNVEQGVTNELFPTERDETPGCALNTLPEDGTNTLASTVLAGLSDINVFSEFMRFLAPLQPQQPPAGQAASVASGQNLFAQVGCALCHTPSMITGNTASPALRNQTVHLYSDLSVHNMGTGLADGITQGLAQGNEFRTAPLWGLEARLFYLHDGRTSNLMQAIQDHASAGSEANGVIAAFNTLTSQAKQDVLNFLMTL